MELIRGERVRDLLARGNLPASRAIALATQVVGTSQGRSRSCGFVGRAGYIRLTLMRR